MTTVRTMKMTKQVMTTVGTMGTMVANVKTTNAQGDAGVEETMWPALPGAGVLVTVTTLPMYVTCMKMSKSRYSGACFMSLAVLK